MRAKRFLKKVLELGYFADDISDEKDWDLSCLERAIEGLSDPAKAAEVEKLRVRINAAGLLLPRRLTNDACVLDYVSPERDSDPEKFGPPGWRKAKADEFSDGDIRDIICEFERCLDGWDSCEAE